MEYHQYFTSVDWLVVAGYLALTTWVGHALKGKQSTIRDFFLGGRTLPWPACVGLYHRHGNKRGYFHWGARNGLCRNRGFYLFAVGTGLDHCPYPRGIYFVRAFYEKEIYSPYDFRATSRDSEQRDWPR